MGKTPARRGQPERRKKSRKERKRKTSSPKKSPTETCLNCRKIMETDSRALFVEEEVGRVFCSEECITSYFTPEVEKLEKEYFGQLTSDKDLHAKDREELGHLRWLTLEEPDEVWREKRETGDCRYTLISEFQAGSKQVWYLCISLFLRGEPSFLFLAFPTRDSAVVDFYRRGERIERAEAFSKEPKGDLPSQTDGLAEAWTEGETLRAQLLEGKKKNDIPMEDYGLYKSCVDETLEEPDEVWVVQRERGSGIKTYHFLRFYSSENPPLWFIIVARETENEDEIEIIDAFPTRNSELAECYRRGKKEVGVVDMTAPSRLVH